MNVVSTVVGYPYIGANREWKRTVEPYWRKEATVQQFEEQIVAITGAVREDACERGKWFNT